MYSMMEHDYKKIYWDIVNRGLECKVAFNVCSLLKGIRGAYLFDYYRGSKEVILRNTIVYLENMNLFRFHYYYFRQSGSDVKKLSKTKFLDDYDRFHELVITLKDNKDAHKILNEDPANEKFGELTGLICAGNLKKMYSSPDKYILGQVVYMVECQSDVNSESKYKIAKVKGDKLIGNGYPSPEFGYQRILFQMCPYPHRQQFLNKMKKDFEKYKQLGEEIGVKIVYAQYPMYIKINQYLPKFMNKLFFNIETYFNNKKIKKNTQKKQKKL